MSDLPVERLPLAHKRRQEAEYNVGAAQTLQGLSSPIESTLTPPPAKEIFAHNPCTRSHAVKSGDPLPHPILWQTSQLLSLVTATVNVCSPPSRPQRAETLPRHRAEPLVPRKGRRAREGARALDRPTRVRLELEPRRGWGWRADDRYAGGRGGHRAGRAALFQEGAERARPPPLHTRREGQGQGEHPPLFPSSPDVCFIKPAHT